MPWRAALPLLFTLVAPPRALAQEPAAVSGYVVDDASRALIPAATLTLVTTGEETQSGPDGSFSFSDAPAGPISMRVSAPGYQGLLWEAEVVAGRVLFLEVLLSRLVGDASFRVFVTDERSGEPIAGAGVAFPELGSSGITDDTGEAVVADIPEGSWLVLITGLGYGSATSFVEFDGTSRVEGDVALAEGPISLEGIVVSGSRSEARLEMVGFRRRELAGIGRHFDRADIEEARAIQASDLFRAVAGIQRSCGPSGRCVLVSRRLPGTFSEQTTCPMPVFIDGVAGMGGIDDISIEWIEAIEAYNGISQVPAQYYRDGACGAVVVWTRR